MKRMLVSNYTEIEKLLENCLNDDSLSMEEVIIVLRKSAPYRENCEIITNMFNHLIHKYRDFFENIIVDVMMKLPPNALQ